MRGREPRGQEAILGQTTEVPWKGHEQEGQYVTFVLRGSLCCCIESRRWAPGRKQETSLLKKSMWTRVLATEEVRVSSCGDVVKVCRGAGCE